MATLGWIALLTPDATITENASVESRLEYAAKHLWEDIAFARTTLSRWSVANIRQEGSTAWVTSNAKVTGSFQGKPVNNTITELMVLRKTTKGWRIQAIHWVDSSIKMTAREKERQFSKRAALPRPDLA